MRSIGRPSPSEISSFLLRQACAKDGAALWRWARATGTLEQNSPYFYLLFASDFCDTCLIAEPIEKAGAGEMAGAVLGYHPPREPDAAFVWQIGVLPRWRGQGLGVQMLKAWRALPGNRGRKWLTTTVAEDNRASQALFERFAREQGASCQVHPHFTRDLFPRKHAAEPLYRIGPLRSLRGNAPARFPKS